MEREFYAVSAPGRLQASLEGERVKLEMLIGDEKGAGMAVMSPETALQLVGQIQRMAGKAIRARIDRMEGERRREGAVRSV